MRAGKERSNILAYLRVCNIDKELHPRLNWIITPFSDILQCPASWYLRVLVEIRRIETHSHAARSHAVQQKVK